MQYIVREPFLAIFEGDDRRFSFEELKAGHVVAVLHYQDRNGMVQVHYDGRVFAVFMRDLTNNCVEVKTAAQ